MRGGRETHTFSIALLVGAPFHALLPLLALGIDAFLGDSVLDAAETGPSVVALLARLLAVSAGVLDLSSLGAGRLGGDETGCKWVHVHCTRVSADGVHGHLGLEVGLGIWDVIAV